MWEKLVIAYYFVRHSRKFLGVFVCRRSVRVLLDSEHFSANVFQNCQRNERWQLPGAVHLALTLFCIYGVSVYV